MYHLRKGNKLFNARIPLQRVKPAEDSVRILQNAELLRKYNDHFFAFRRKSGSRPQAWGKPLDLIYIQGADYYTIPVTGIPDEKNCG
jgi:hypothetical protein